jgi:NUMOD4 motif
MTSDLKIESDIEWRNIVQFPNYEISNKGEVYNTKYGRVMKTSLTPFGHVKITLTSDLTGERFTRSVAKLVGEAFVEPPDPLCDDIVVLDGNFQNLASENLVWRPRWFAWRYTHQFRQPQPHHYQVVAIINLVTGREYDSVIDTAMVEGLLFEDVWRSTYTKEGIYPYGDIFAVIK